MAGEYILVYPPACYFCDGGLAQPANDIAQPANNKACEQANCCCPPGYMTIRTEHKTAKFKQSGNLNKAIAKFSILNCR